MSELLDDVRLSDGTEEAGTPEFSFATVESVTAEGVTLQFDGAESASNKAYRCNAAQRFAKGDRVKIHKDSGSYVVEYVLGNPGARYPLPAGGTLNQVLAKSGAKDYEVKWMTVPPPALSELLPSGTTGQFLRKTATSCEWASVNQVPTGGTAGQVLAKTSSGFAWQDAPAASNGLPTGGSSGQVLTKSSSTNYACSWTSIDTLPSSGTTGYWLRKSRTGTEWAALPIVGTSSSIGFMGKATAYSKQTVSNLTTPSTATASTIASKLNDLLTALRNYGLIG